MSSPEPTPERPVYSKVDLGRLRGTTDWCVTVDEGWRQWILCTGMYEWSADHLLQILNASEGGWPR